MFDIGFGELVVVAVVALLVLGPERLPIAARAFAKCVIKLRREAGKIGQNLTNAPNERNGDNPSIAQLRRNLAAKIREVDAIRQNLEQQLNSIERDK